MCSGSSRIIGGFVFLLLLLSSGSGWGQDLTFGKQKVIALTFELETLLRDIGLQTKNLENQSVITETQITSETKKDEQHSIESEKTYDEQAKISIEQEAKFSELSNLFGQSEAALKASQSATELAVSVAVIAVTAAIIEGLVIIFKK